jgi:hypothetical protein
MENNYNGFRAKTVNIRTYTGVTKFELQQSNELGLPENSIVTGIMVRQHSKDKKASNYEDLVASEVFENAYITLKSHRKTEGISTILDTCYLPEGIDRSFLFEPIKSQYIDWNNSFISINKRAKPDLVDNRVIELVIIYRPFQICTLESGFNFRTGVKLLGTRRRTKFLPLVSGRVENPLSGSANVGLPRNSWVVGFSTLSNQFPLEGEPMSSDAYSSSFLTLKRMTDCFIESFPIELVDYQDVLFPDLDYFPIEPVKVLDLDWESSKLNINNGVNAITGQVFQIQLIYVMADNNELLTTNGPILSFGE